jgi:hypothetical protein
VLHFITFDDIERLTKSLGQSRQQILAKAQRPEGKNVFLSHSSKDSAYLPLVIEILEHHGAEVYVDVKDSDLPLVPSLETARVLREKLLGCKKFILFVTTNSKDSRWIPWELGLGDGQKKPANVALIPAAPHAWDQQWAEQEYLGLYDRIIWGNLDTEPDPQWLVYNYHANTAVPLRAWLQM